MMLTTKIFLSAIFLFSFILVSPTPIQNNIYSQINPNLDIIDSNSYNNKQKIFSDEYLIFAQSDNSSDNITNPDEITDEDIEKNKEKNKNFLFFILAGFVAIILITFIVVYTYIKCHENTVEEVIEEDQNYSDIGGLTPSKNETDISHDEKNEENKKEE